MSYRLIFRGYIFIVFLSSFTKMNVNAQCVSAGDSTLFYYVDLNPDTTVIGYGPYNPPDTCYIDVNNDHVVDFQIVAWGRMNAMTSYAYSFIKGAGNNLVLQNTINPTFPDTLIYGDTICNAGMWTNKSYLIDRYTVFGSPFNSYDYGYWNGKNYFVGLKVVNPVDSAFGWIELFCNGSGGYNYIVVKRFGMGFFNTPPISNNAENFLIFPNPSIDYIEMNLEVGKNYDVSIINIIGQVVYKGKCNPTDKNIHISTKEINPGLYFLKLIASDETITKTFIVGKNIQ